MLLDTSTSNITKLTDFYDAFTDAKVPEVVFINSEELLLGITTRIYFPSLRIMVRIIVFTDLDTHDTGNLSGPGPSVWCLYMYKMRV